MIDKNGNILSENFYESKYLNIYYKQTPGDWDSDYAYIPGTENNLCLNSRHLNINGRTGKYYISLKVDWSGFDTSNNDGEFRIFFQGDIKWDTDDAFNWNHNNYATVALNAQQSLSKLVLSKDKGSYIYSTYFTIPNDVNIIKARLGIRTDYSNGKGIIHINNVFVIHEDDYKKVKIGTDSTVADDFIEF